jgi:hypothetical protein
VLTLHIFTYTPPTQVLLGTKPGKWEHAAVDIAEPNVDAYIADLKAPLGGEVLVAREVTRVTSRIVNEVRQA